MTSHTNAGLRLSSSLRCATIKMQDCHCGSCKKDVQVLPSKRNHSETLQMLHLSITIAHHQHSWFWSAFAKGMHREEWDAGTQSIIKQIRPFFITVSDKEQITFWLLVVPSLFVVRSVSTIRKEVRIGRTQSSLPYLFVSRAITSRNDTGKKNRNNVTRLDSRQASNTLVDGPSGAPPDGPS